MRASGSVAVASALIFWVSIAIVVLIMTVGTLDNVASRVEEQRLLQHELDLVMAPVTTTATSSVDESDAAVLPAIRAVSDSGASRSPSRRVELVWNPWRARNCVCCCAFPAIALFTAQVSGFLVATSLPIVAVALFNTAGPNPSCPAFLSDSSLPAPSRISWPAGCMTSACWETILDVSRLSLAASWISAVAIVSTGLLVVFFAQASLLLQRDRDAKASAKHMHSALRYISHEARSPLNGAVLSLTLLDGIINSASPGAGWEEAPGLVGDLHASVEAAKRQLDDILTFERVTSTSAAKAVPWGWCRVAGSELRRLRSSFAGVCRAERIQLQFVGVLPNALPESASHHSVKRRRPSKRRSRQSLQVGDSMHRRNTGGHRQFNSVCSDGVEFAGAPLRDRTEASPTAAGGAQDAVRPPSWTSSCSNAGDSGSETPVDALLTGFVPQLGRFKPPPRTVGWNTTSYGFGAPDNRTRRLLRKASKVRLNTCFGVEPLASSDSAGDAAQSETSDDPTVRVSPDGEWQVGASVAATSEGSRSRVHHHIAAPSHHLVSTGQGGLTMAEEQPSLDHIAGWEVFTDIDRLMTVIGNALSNSVKFVPGAGRGKVVVSLALGSPLLLPGHEPKRFPDEQSALSSHSAMPCCQRASDSCCRCIGLHKHPSARVQPAQPSGDNPQPSAQPPTRGQSSSRAQAESRVLVVEVLDNGCGIAPDRLRSDELFRPFQQLRMGDGMLSMAAGGLGLSTVRAIVVDQMGGDVGLSSREGEGTLFTARVPVWARRVGHPGARELMHGTSALGGEVLPNSAQPGKAGRADSRSEASGASFSQGHKVKPTEGALDDSKQSETWAQRRRQVRWSRRGSGQDDIDVTDVARARMSRSRSQRLSLWTNGGSTSSHGGSRVFEAVAPDDARSNTSTVVQPRVPPQALPFAPGQQSALSANVPRAQPSPVVWVVDDVAVARRSVARALRAWGLDVREIEDGRDMVDAVEALLRHAPGDGTRSSPPAGWPCAIVLDSRMPRLGGAAALREARGLVSSSGCGWGLVAIGATGSGPGSSEASELESSGASCVLGKPILPGELAGALVESVQGVALPFRVQTMATQ